MVVEVREEDKEVVMGEDNAYEECEGDVDGECEECECEDDDCEECDCEDMLEVSKFYVIDNSLRNNYEDMHTASNFCRCHAK